MAIANLLPSDGDALEFGALEPARLASLEGRLKSAAAYWAAASGVSLDEDFAEDLEDLGSDVSTVAAQALLGRIEVVRRDEFSRRDAEAHPIARGRFVLHRLACSLETGEAEIASRGFFDVWDRPPLMLWLEVVSRPLSGRAGAFDVAILAFVPEECVTRAEEGRIACQNGSLSFLDEESSELAAQLKSLLGDTAAC